MPNFSTYLDSEIVDFIFDDLFSFGSENEPNTREIMKTSVANGSIVIEKREYGFCVVSRANRRHPGPAAVLCPIPPESELMFLYVNKDSRDAGLGESLIQYAKDTYMEDQAMKLVCSGTKRKEYFEKFGFVIIGTTHGSKYVMACPPITVNVS